MKTTKYFNPRPGGQCQGVPGPLELRPAPGRDRTTAAAAGSATKINPLRGAETVEVGNRDDFSGNVEPGDVTGTNRRAT
jgi:hypothetical protein